MSLTKSRGNKLIIYGSLSCMLLLVSIFIQTSMAWQLASQLHIVIETIAVAFAIFIAAAAFIRFQSQKHHADIILTVGWIGTALLDSYYGLITFLPITTPNIVNAHKAELQIWFASRLFLAIFLGLYWFTDYITAKQGTFPLSSQTFYLLLSGIILLFFLCFVYIPLPFTTQTNHLFARPQELIPALFFGITFVSIWYRRRWVRGNFDHWFILALIFNLATQTFFMLFSQQRFDAPFTIAHILKTASYLILLIGFAFDVIRLLRLYTAREQQIIHTNNSLKREIAERQQLEQKFQNSLTRRQRQVQTSTEIAQEIAATVATTDLFRKVVTLVQKRFDYYHVQVYTKENGHLVMQEGTGAVGLQLKSQGHQIPLRASRSLVAYAAFNGESLLVPDVSEDPYWLPNVLLPDTQSEIAIPIKLGTEVLGVLDVQSDQIHGLDEEDQLLLLGLCGQIAVAINNRRLKEEQEQANIALQQYAAELERSNQELQSFAYIASHDLQEPLRMVSNFVQLLQRRYGGQLDEKADMYIEHAIDGAKRMRTLIDDLLSYSRVGTQTKQFTNIDCNQILTRALTNLSITIEEQKATITHDPLPTVWGDGSQLMLLFQNLISNAIKFRADADPKIHVGVTAENRGWCFCVQDNGIGLDSKDAERIFVIFQRLHSKQAYPGTGIGLAICKKIVERHNGRIWVESQPNHGSTFYFTLPTKPNFDIPPQSGVKLG